MSEKMTIDSLAQEIRKVDGANTLGAGALAEALMPFIRAELESLRRDAERYRFLWRKICFIGNGDGTSSMHAINLPCRVQGFPRSYEEGKSFIDNAIDAALEADNAQHDPD